MNTENKSLRLIAIIAFLSVGFLLPQASMAQLEIGGGVLIRSMKPGTGWGLSGELGIPTDGDWRMALRASIGMFGASIPDYREIADIDWTHGDTTYVKPYDGLKMSSFDRSVGFRIYYQVTEFQPYFGISATYAYNDIEEPANESLDYLDRSLNFDYILGASYMMTDHWNFLLELQMTNVTRANYIANEGFVSFNFGISYRFGTNRFSNVYE
ncbi:hypothetical protein EP331_02360 [bacterium]|nr:MAG: hypothetical protein EP331_02360 [bacterium]